MTKQEVGKKLSQAIFGKSWHHLNLDEKFFAYLHIRWFSAYRKKIASLARQTMAVSRLSGRDYLMIFDWYLGRVPTQAVTNAITECWDYAKRNRKAIYSMNYFKRAVTRHFEYHLSHCTRREMCDGDDLDWHYQSYVLWKAGNWPGWKFCPFEGPNPHSGYSGVR